MPEPVERKLGQAGAVGTRLRTTEAFSSRVAPPSEAACSNSQRVWLSFPIIRFLTNHGEPTKPFPDPLMCSERAGNLTELRDERGREF